MKSISQLRSMTVRTMCLGSHPGIIQSTLDYEYLCGHDMPSLTAIVASNRKQERYFWGESEIVIPVIDSIDALSSDQKRKINTIINFQSGRRVLPSTVEAIEKLPNIKIISIFAEQVPEAHAQELIKASQAKDIIVAGPASVGLLIPGVVKLGAIGGTQHPQIVSANILEGGYTAVISTSGGMVNELIHIVTGTGNKVSFAFALGGDRFPITSPAEAFLLAENDNNTSQIVYFGELGGTDEYEIAELVRAGKITKKIIAYIAGTVAELFEEPPQFGHAKAMAQTSYETAQAKKHILKEVNVQVVDTFTQLVSALEKNGRPEGVSEHSSKRTIGKRQKHLIISRISGDKEGDAQLLGGKLVDRIEDNTFASLTISMLLGQMVSSPRLIEFTDHALRLLIDHGPYVAGATNTIVAARAGKDLVSSLAAGMLTIGPRFGGAINQAAEAWLNGVASNLTPMEYVDTFKSRGGIIPGIGHKKYRIDLPDPRLQKIFDFSKNTEGKYLDFALKIQNITTAKKGNLILNVDGAIAAVLLDLLEAELGYNQDKLQELIEIEFFNALFVLSRSVGLAAHYLDQRRNDEGLLRLTDKEILYLPEDGDTSE